MTDALIRRRVADQVAEVVARRDATRAGRREFDRRRYAKQKLQAEKLARVQEDTQPIGVFNVDQIETEGVKYAHALAAVCDDPAALDRVNAQTLARVGVESFGYVAANALRVMTEHILSPVLDVASAQGTDLREGLRAIADGRDPSTGDPLQWRPPRSIGIRSSTTGGACVRAATHPPRTEMARSSRPSRAATALGQPR